MEVTFLTETRFGWAQFTGPWTVDTLCAQIDPLLAECLSRKHRRLLIDWSLLGPRKISTLERYRLGASAQVFLEKLDRVATVIPPYLLDPDQFGVRVAQNRGVNVRAFSDLEEAQRWLLEKKG